MANTWDGWGSASIAGGAGLLGTAVSGYFDSKAQDDANYQNAVSQWMNQKFQAAEAQKQRDWSEEMSNTAYQRQRSDLIKAGYNPLLALTGGGASSPSASLPSSSATHFDKSNPFSGLSGIASSINTALEVAKTAKELEKKDEEIKNIDVDTTKKHVDTIMDVVKPVSSATGAYFGAKAVKHTLAKVAPSVVGAAAGAAAAKSAPLGSAGGSTSLATSAMSKLALGSSSALLYGAALWEMYQLNKMNEKYKVPHEFRDPFNLRWAAEALRRPHSKDEKSGGLYYGVPAGTRLR